MTGEKDIRAQSGRHAKAGASSSTHEVTATVVSSYNLHLYRPGQVGVNLGTEGLPMVFGRRMSD